MLLNHEDLCPSSDRLDVRDRDRRGLPRQHDEAGENAVPTDAGARVAVAGHPRGLSIPFAIRRSFCGRARPDRAVEPDARRGRPVAGAHRGGGFFPVPRLDTQLPRGRSLRPGILGSGRHRLGEGPARGHDGLDQERSTPRAGTGGAVERPPRSPLGSRRTARGEGRRAGRTGRLRRVAGAGCRTWFRAGLPHGIHR